MARREEDREDLLREATAFIERIELRTLAFDEPLFLGFRKNGCASVYFGQDLVYHFNSHNKLRRAYVAPRLLKAQRGRLVALSRNRVEDETQLLRDDLTEEEALAFCQYALQSLNRLADALERQDFEFMGQVPEQADIIGRATDWVRRLIVPGELSVAESPHAH